MKTKHGITILSFTILSILAFAISSWAQEIIGCASMDGRTTHRFGDSWTEVYNGVVYECKCIRPSGTPVCKPRGQSTSSPQSQGGSSVTPEQQLAQGVANFFVGLIFPKKINTSRQAENDKQNAIKRQQEEGQEREAARQAANQAWANLQIQEQELREIDKADKLEAGKDLLGKMETIDSGELKLKTLGTEDFQGDAVDLRGKQGIVGSLKTNEEQAEFENMHDAWVEEQGELFQQRLKEPNKLCSEICTSLESDVPLPPLSKDFDQLQPGDVLLIKGAVVPLVDNMATSGDGHSSAQHTVIFLKEVKGVKLFLDNQPFQGPRIISQEEFLKEYGKRGADVARLKGTSEETRLVGQPLNKEEGDRLFHAAVAMAQKNRQAIANNMFGSRILGTNYGVKGEDIVCSESDWALLNIAIKKTRGEIPKTGDRIKIDYGGINWSPADFQNQRYFLVTPLIMPK